MSARREAKALRIVRIVNNRANEKQTGGVELNKVKYHNHASRTGVSYKLARRLIELPLIWKISRKTLINIYFSGYISSSIVDNNKMRRQKFAPKQIPQDKACHETSFNFPSDSA